MSVLVEMPEVLEAAKRADGDATCTTGEIPHVIQQVLIGRRALRPAWTSTACDLY